MTGVAEQRDAPPRPALHWAAHHKRPFVRGVDTVDKRLNILMPAAEVVGEFAFSAFDSPGFHLPVIALDYTDEVHKLAAPYRIVQHVAAWPEPIRSDHSCETRRQPFHRHQAAPRHATSKLGTAGA